jgi:bifunctional non-homologous end joining protein LigD
MLAPEKTTERGRAPKAGNGERDRHVFVMHAHRGSSLHFDLGIEIGGKLKMWRLKEMPSADPNETSTATLSGEQPLEQVDFEGVVKRGARAGTFMVWDRGTVSDLAMRDGGSISRDLKNGYLELELQGQRMKGAYSLVRIAKGSEQVWLLRKLPDEWAGESWSRDWNSWSVASGRTLVEIEEDAQRSERTVVTREPAMRFGRAFPLRRMANHT